MPDIKFDIIEAQVFWFLLSILEFPKPIDFPCAMDFYEFKNVLEGFVPLVMHQLERKFNANL